MGVKIFYRFTVPCVFEFSRCAQAVSMSRSDRRRSAMTKDPGRSRGKGRGSVQVENQRRYARADE
jgi:hypothetical protein